MSERKIANNHYPGLDVVRVIAIAGIVLMHEENSLKDLVWSYSKTLHAKRKGCCTLSRGKKLCEEILHEYGYKCNRSRCQPR